MSKIEKEVRRLIGFGYFDTVIAGRLGITKEEVHEIRMEKKKKDREKAKYEYIEQSEGEGFLVELEE